MLDVPEKKTYWRYTVREIHKSWPMQSPILTQNIAPKVSKVFWGPRTVEFSALQL